MPRYIDAERLKQTLQELEYRSNNLKATIAGNEVLHDFIFQIIDDEPTADVQEIKHGRWIEKDSRYVHNFKCSVCNDVRFDIPTCMGKPLFNFCPNCGAKMDLEDGEEDAVDR